MCGRVDATNHRGMNLLDLEQWPRGALRIGGAEGGEKSLAVALNVLCRIVRGETEVQALAAVASGSAALARAESMDQPWDC
jgi:hypothetical protein